MEKEAKQGKLDELEAMDTSQDQGKERKKDRNMEMLLPCLCREL